MSGFLNFELDILDSLGAIYSDAMDKAMVFFSEIGSIGIIWIVLALIFIFIKSKRKCGVTVLIALVLGFVVCNLILKECIWRDRPFEYRDIELLISAPTDSSFPSGHTTSSFAAATALCLSDKRFGIFAWPVAILTAFSRMYLYVHFPSDIVAGVMIGVMMAFLAKFITERFPCFKGYNSLKEE